MFRKFNIFYNRKFKKFIRHRFAAIYEINKRYSAPNIEITPAVKTALSLLLFYLVAMVGLIIYKFISVIR